MRVSTGGVLETFETHHNDERIHTQFRIISVLFREPWVDNIIDTVDGDTCFGDVGGDDDLSRTRWSRIEDPRLHFRRQGGVNGQDQEIWDLRTQCLHPLVKHFARSIDFFLSRQEQEDVSWRLGEMNLHDGDQRSV